MKLYLSTIFIVMVILSPSFELSAQDRASTNQQSSREAYEAQREQLQRDLANRNIGTGIAYYTGGSCTGSSAQNATNGTFYFRGPNGTWTGDDVQEYSDLEECINAMLNEPTCDGGTIIWGKGSDGTVTNDATAMYKIWTPGNNSNRGRTYNFDGQGKIRLEWNTGTNIIEWGMINVAFKKPYNSGLPTAWPNDTVIFSNITIDGCAAWSGDNDDIMNRGTTPEVTHTWPLLWVNNHKAVIIINNGAFFQNSCSKKVSNTDFDAALKAGAFILRKGKCFMYGGAFMDNDVRNTGGYTNSTASGGALFVKDGDSIEGVTYPTAEFYMYGGSFIGNSSNATKDNFGGGAMYISGKAKLMGGMIGGDILGEGNQFVRRGNLANQGGGLVVVKGADVEIGGSVTISHNGTYNNANASGGGVYICGNSAENNTLININGGEISHNTSANKGGGLYLAQHSTVNINGGSINSNHVINKLNTGYESGGGIFVSDSANLILDEETSVNNNTATYHGGGIYACRNANVSLKDCTITRNVCDSVNSTISAHFYGGGFYFGTTNMNYQRIISSAGLEAGAKYIFVASTTSNPNSYVAMGHQNNHNRTQVGVSVSSDVVSLIPAASPSDMTSAYEFVLGGSTGEWTLFDPVNNGYLYASDTVGTTGPSMDVQAVLDNRGKWKDTWSGEKVLFTSNTTSNYTRNKINLKSDKSFFSCFATQQSTTISLYKNVSSESNHGSITISDNAKVFGNFAGSNTGAPASNLYLGEVSNTGSNKSVININGILRQNANVHVSTPSPSAGDTIARGTTTPAYTITTSDSEKIHFDNNNFGTKPDGHNQVVLSHHVTISFDLNGPELGEPVIGGGVVTATPPMQGVVGEVIILPTPSALQMHYESDYLFIGWATTADATQGNMTYTITDETDVTLYAIWSNHTNTSFDIYLDNGHNIITGEGAPLIGSIDNPASTLSTAYFLLLRNITAKSNSATTTRGRIIIINNPCRINVSRNVDWTGRNFIIQRYQGDVNGYPNAYTGDMFLLKGGINLKLKGIIIDGGYNGTDKTKAHGSIINLGGDGNTFIMQTGCVLRNNYNEYRQSISDNSGLGGAVHAVSSDTLVMETGSSIESCFAKSGGGIYSYNATVKMKGGIIGGGTDYGNGATDYGSAIAAFATSTIELTDGTISHNFDCGNTLNGTVYIQDNGSCKLAKNENNGTVITVSHNKAKYGGGISAKNTTLEMLEGLVYHNTATTNGGGMYVQDAAMVTFEGGYISNNTASRGGGVYICTGAKFIAENGDLGTNGTFGQIIQNKALSAGGGVYIEPTAGYAAKGYLYVAGAVVIMTNTLNNIYNNVFIPIEEIGNNAIIFKNHLQGYVGLSTEAPPTAANPVLVGVSDELGITLLDTDAENIYSDDSRYASRLNPSTGAIYLEIKEAIPGGEANIYLDGVYGDDANNGTAPVAGVPGSGIGPVKTFDKAKSLMNESGSTIHIVNTVTIKTTGQAWSFNDMEGCIVKRYDGNIEGSTACTDTLIYIKDHGYLTLNGITIDGGNVAGVTSPLIAVGVDGVLTIFDGCILQNNSNTTGLGGTSKGDGGAINIAAGGTVNMYSGCYVRNNTSKNGGGIFMEDKKSSTVNGHTTIKTSRLITGEGVEISGNTASGTGTNGCGGGIYCGQGYIDFYGGYITNNHAANEGGGIYLQSERSSKTSYMAGGLHISTNPIVSGNSSANNNNDNIFLKKDSSNLDLFISQDDGLEAPASLGISLDEYPSGTGATSSVLVARSDGYNNGLIPEDEAAFFICDNSRYKTELRDDGNVYIVAKEYWKEHVRTKPTEGWVESEREISVTGYNNTTKLIYRTLRISTPEALAWLISTVNGLNGQIAYDYAPFGQMGEDETVVINWIYLENDIDISAYLWTPIGVKGTGGAADRPFNGYFYGNGHTISGCSIFENELDYVGLFGYAPNIMLSDVGLVNSSNNGHNYVGGLVGYVNPTLIAYDGFPPFGHIINSYFIGELKGSDYIGGIAGYTNAWVRNCYSVQQTLTSGTHKGSVVGHYAGSSANNDIEYCYGNSDLDIIGGIDNSTLTKIRKLQGETTDFNDIINIEISGVTTPFYNLADALNGYVVKATESGTYTNGDLYPDIYKWKTASFSSHPYHANEYDYWIDVVETKADAGIGYVEVYEGTTLKEIHLKSAAGLAWLISVVNGRSAPNTVVPNNLEDVYVYLDDDIDMSGHEYTPIGSHDHPFNGIFDTDGHTIKGIYICNFSGTYGEGGWYNPNSGGGGLISTGFFGETGEKAIVRNLNLDSDCYITSRTNYLGGIAGTNKGELFNCCQNGLVGGHGNVGGLVGNNIGKIHNCYLKSEILAAKQTTSATNYFGGISAVNNGEIKNSYALLQIDATNLQLNRCGLITGNNTNSGIVEYVYLKRFGGVSNIAAYGNNTGSSSSISMFTGTNVLAQPITVTNTTLNMLTALNEFVNEEQIGMYSTWAITEGVNEDFPYFNYDEPFANTPPTVKWNEYVSDTYVANNQLAFAGGTGTKENPYLIDNEERLALLAGLVNAEITHYGAITYASGGEARDNFYNKYYKVTKNLDMAEYEWTRIGKDIVRPDSVVFLEDYADGTINPFFTQLYQYNVPDITNSVSNSFTLNTEDGFISNPSGNNEYYSWCYEFTIPSDALTNTINVSFDCSCTNANPTQARCYVQKLNNTVWESIVQEHDTIENPWISLKGFISTEWRTFDVDQFISNNVSICTQFVPGTTYRISWKWLNTNGIMHIDNLRVSYDVPVGTDYAFSGQIDGDGHFIDGIYINETDNVHGFVGGMKKENGHPIPTIKNIGMSSSFIKHLNGAHFIGGVVGYNDGGHIINCYNSGYIYGSDNIGGIAGYNCNGGRIYNCYNVGSVIGQENVGGIAGFNQFGSTVANSYNRGSVNAKRQDGGGIIGENQGRINNVYNASLVTGNAIGGVIGRNTATANAEECYWRIDDAKNGVFKGVINANGLAFNGSNGSWIFENSQTATFDRNGSTLSTKDLIIALNSKVQYSNSDDHTNYNMWSTEVNANDTYPMFSDVYNFSGNVLWYATNPSAEEYSLRTASDLKGLAGLNNHYDSEANQYCYYDEEGVILGYGETPGENNSIACNNFSGKTIRLTENIVFNDGTFMDDGTYTAGATQILSVAQWEPIGDLEHPFSGFFDGGRNYIKGLYYSSTKANDIAGLLGVATGTLEGIGLENSYFEISGNNSYVGGICGKLTNTSTTKMQDCYFTGYVNNKGTGNSYAGGLVGWLDANSYLYNSYNWANVNTSSSVNTAFAGGIVGLNNGRIENTYNTGNITAYLNGTTNKAGTIAGKNTGTIDYGYYLQMTGAQVTGTGSTGTENKTSYFSGLDGICNLHSSPYNYPNLKSTLNAWCSYQSEPYDNWIIDETYPFFMNNDLFWTDMVTEKPAGFNVSGNTITISNAEGLAWLVSVVNGYNNETGNSLAENTIVIANDIDMIDYQWIAIGTERTPFRGKVQGNQYVINNINKNMLKDASDTLIGLFGRVSDAEIRDVVTNNAIYSFVGNLNRINIGGVAAKVDGNSRIIGCRSSNVAYLSNNSWMGGLVGWLKGTSQIISVSTMCQAAGYNLGGIVYRMESGTSLINSYSKTMSIDKNTGPGTVTTNFQGGLVGDNDGTVSNCYYLRNRSQSENPTHGSTKGFLAGRNTGTLEYCYCNNKFIGTLNSYYGTNTNGVKTGTMTGCGYFIYADDSEVTSGIPAADPRRFTQKVFLQRIENGSVVDVTEASTYATANTTTLNTALNNWRNGNVTDDNFEWINATNALNVNYPLLRYSSYEAVASKGFGQLMFYHKRFLDILQQYNEEENGGTIALINDASLKNYVISNDTNVKIYIKDDVSLLHDEGSVIRATAETFIDNSAANAQLTSDTRDWHFTSFSVKDMPIGINYVDSETQIPYGANSDDIHNNIIIEDNSIIPFKSAEEMIKWDFYSFHEPDYHWINFKRPSNSHWHEDGTHDNISYTNENVLIPGKGYMLAFEDEQTLLPQGELNNGEVTLPSFKNGANYCTGYNLIGNPFQSYLDFKRFADANSDIMGDNLAYYVYDKDKGGFMTYTYGATVTNLDDKIASQFINMHQGFFIISTGTNGSNIIFNNDMRTNETDVKSKFRGSIFNNFPLYPLISVLMKDENNSSENVVVELSRPDNGGAMRLTDVKDGLGSIYIPKDNKDYWVLFMNEVDNIALYFEAYYEATFSLEINTRNSTFSYLHLIDNITGADVDLLQTNTYEFTGKPSDYKARFRLVFQYTGMEENNEEPSNKNFAYYNDGDYIIDGEGVLQLIDLQGRILTQKHVSGDNNRVTLPKVSSGVYILRLLSEEIKTQKVILK